MNSADDARFVITFVSPEGPVLDFTAIYHSLILALADDTGASDSLLHVHAGLAVLFIARLVTRRSLATIIPFSIVCVAELANETMDALHLGEIRMPDTLFDLVNTLFWPFMLMIGLRWRDLRGMPDQRT